LVRMAMLDRKRVGVSDNRLRTRMPSCRSRIGGKRSRDLVGPFRIIAGQRDPHLLGSLLHIRDVEAKPMPHRSTAVLAG
jgi:hypothetical protein